MGYMCLQHLFVLYLLLHIIAHMINIFMFTSCLVILEVEMSRGIFQTVCFKVRRADIDLCEDVSGYTELFD